ncbi:P-type conjugative transfer protein TrbL [Lautropia mirabilis]
MTSRLLWPCVVFASLFLLCETSIAQVTSEGVLDGVAEEFHNSAASWATVIEQHATYLFLTLGTISLSWTFGFMLLRKAEIGEFFVELIRFMIFFGFFLWLLKNGPEMARDIMRSLSTIGAEASGHQNITPSGVMDIGFSIVSRAFSASNWSSPVDSVIGVLLSVFILVVITTIAVNLLMLYIASWVLSYAGIIFLGFGGSRWTSDMAIGYYKTVLGNATQMMATILLTGISSDILGRFYDKMQKDSNNAEELAILLVVCIATSMFVNKIPPMISGIATGSGIGNVGGYSPGGLVSSAATAGAMVASGVAGAAGMAKGIAAAKAMATQDVAKGVDGLTKAINAIKAQGSGHGSSSPSGNPSVQSNGSGYGTMSGAARVAKTAVGTGANIVRGAASAARKSFDSRVDQSFGGRIAASLKEKQQEKNNSRKSDGFQGLVQPINTLSGSKPEPVDAEAETAAFVNKGN